MRASQLIRLLEVYNTILITDLLLMYGIMHMDH